MFHDRDTRNVPPGCGYYDEVRMVVGRVWGRTDRLLNSDLRQDCMQVGALAHWRLSSILSRLPSTERRAYLRACVDRTVRHFLRGELRRQRQTVPLDDTLPAEPCGSAAIAGVSLLDQVERPELARALRQIPARDRAVLDLYFAAGLQDSEIAAHLGVTPAAAKMRRTRALARVRAGLAGVAAPARK